MRISLRPYNATAFEDLVFAQASRLPLARSLAVCAARDDGASLPYFFGFGVGLPASLANVFTRSNSF
jgi:hypothetical protein